MTSRRLVGYGWGAGHSRQVTWGSLQGEIHELWQVKSGLWQYKNLTTYVGAPAASLFPIVGYDWPAGGTKQIAYAGEDGHIYELWTRANADWSVIDLSKHTGAPALSDSAVVSAYSSVASSTKQVVYQGQDYHIHELYVAPNGDWIHADLTKLAGAPNPGGEVTLHAFDWPAKGSKQVVYSTIDGVIHELSCLAKGSWFYANLTNRTGAPPANPLPLVGYAWHAGQSKQVVYLGQDNHLHELWITLNGTWKHTDLTKLTATAPSIVGLSFQAARAFAWEAGQAKQVLNCAAGSQIQELAVSVGHGWSSSLLPNKEVDSQPYGFEWTWDKSKNVVYSTSDYHVHLLSHLPTGGWTDLDISAQAKMPLPA